MKNSRFKTQKVYLSTLITIFLLLLKAPLFSQTDNTTVRWNDALEQANDWYSQDEAIRIADNVLVYQNENGGWPKNIDMAKPLTSKEAKHIIKAQKEDGNEFGRTTIDNGATHTQLRYLAKVYEQKKAKRFKAAFLSGIEYLLEAQYKSGGWPQYYPIRKGYYENITFNDGAMIGAMEMLRDITEGHFDFVDSEYQARVQKALDKGLDVILSTQIKVDGKLTAWCAQYDPVSLEPVAARSYELASISGSESVGIVRYLMALSNPNDEVKRAIQSAVQWFEAVKITGIRLLKKEDASLPKGYDLVVGFDPAGSDPLWARFYEIDTNYPIFVDRDGVVQYALSEIKHERRVGYRWLGNWAKRLLEEEYPKWRTQWLAK